MKGGRRSRTRGRLRRKKNRFINSIRFPLHFPSVLRFPLSSSPVSPVLRNSSPPDEREYSRQSGLFARSRAISLFVIASNSSGRYPAGDKRARNLNKTNQYSNPPRSLALTEFPKRPDPHPPPLLLPRLFPRFFIYFVHLYFPPSPSHLRLLGFSRSLVCSDSSFIGTISRHLIYSRPFVEIGRSPPRADLFNLCTDWVPTARMIGFILQLQVPSQGDRKKYQLIKSSCGDNGKKLNKQERKEWRT